MKTSALGKVYNDGDIIVNQGDTGDCMYVIQSGRVEVIQSDGDKVVCLAQLSDGDFFGEMALFEHEKRSSTVRAKGDVTVLTVDKKTLLRRINADPSMAFRLLQTMSSRIRELDAQLTHILSAQ